MKKELRIGFTGGGTGGHIYPLLAVADSVKEKLRQLSVDFTFYYFGSPGQYSQEFVERNFKIVRIIPFKVRRYASLSNVIDAIKFPISLIQAFIKMLFVMPDVIFSKGGTGAIAVVIAAWFYRIPVFIHESDSIPGLSSKISSSFAKRAAVSFQKTLDIFSGERVALTGNPVRPFLLEPAQDLNGEKAKRIFGFDPALPLILVLGGSQGSKRINEFMLDNVKDFVGKYQILHQVGVDNFKEFKNELAVATEHFIPAERARYKIVDFLKKDIKEAMIASDIIVSRAGSGAIFEIATFQKPSILIPLTESAGNHQFYNAYEYAREGAATVIEEENLKPALFFSQLELIMGNKSKYNLMAQAAGKFAKPKAAEVIAQELIGLAS
jgi:UDP-N-acetylglucosamine--N-acetylmuramyl-(pentapeptide) pyrophosphoryl-undecaprenol N-acetylglucosamine transferase